MRTFHHILANTLVASITNSTLWFALTFWVYLETRSVFATGTIAGIYVGSIALSGFWFGSIVDHHYKRSVMLLSSAVSFGFYALALGLLFSVDSAAFAVLGQPYLWMLIVLVMAGVLAGNLRTIVLPTVVTVLIPEDRRDKANGLVGMTTGIAFLTTSMISGFLVAWGGMRGALIFGLALTLIAFLHILMLKVEGDRIASDANPDEKKTIDLKGTLGIITAIPGLISLILFATFNNFLGGVFMALMDAYGLSLVSVQTWGLFFGVLSTAFIISGIVISKTGLGKNPLRTLLFVNVIAWTVCMFFTIQSSIVLLGIGMFIWMLVGPYAEAAEHTTLQKVVPPERQGRVFGFAQSVEQAAAPLTAFLIGPFTEFVVIPFMTEGRGAQAIGGWFGTGPARGIALVFTVAGIVGLTVTLLAFRSRAYRDLSARYQESPEAEVPTI
jgi:DHA3 family multidrug efflux protein-like MFS transporter